MKNETMIYIPDLKVFMRVSEGTGDNLLDEDRELGYVDYVNIDTYVWNGDELVEDDGGLMLLKEYFTDKYATEQEYIRDAMEFMFGYRDFECVEIEKGE